MCHCEMLGVFTTTFFISAQSHALSFSRLHADYTMSSLPPCQPWCESPLVRLAGTDMAALVWSHHYLPGPYTDTIKTPTKHRSGKRHLLPPKISVAVALQYLHQLAPFFGFSTAYRPDAPSLQTDHGHSIPCPTCVIPVSVRFSAIALPPRSPPSSLWLSN